ncbi:hypothetical protein LOTGIDRAFT_165378 [Lottia gigantea]|uniref:Uncharacterized protein n=1 Tax=Lottia gigantea TaxID=225164 RepID=V4A0Y5_LOTGI|nr:hypothetical protein LOTGIDRAFT_165378 [Lottia gigantea]ESO88595.1 hypothetical protein LOTGIDRAFT_165378 [Lottia gigantea]
MDSMFIRKNANCFLLFELNDKDLSQIIQSKNHGMDRDAFKKTGPETRRLQDVEKYLNKVIPDEEESDDYAEDYPPIIREIDELEEEIARENSGQGITFLFDNNEELLNRLEIILAAMKEGHRSHRQYNEVNCILKRLLEKGIIDKNDYKSVIKNVK